MKKNVLLLIGLLLINCAFTGSNGLVTGSKASPGDSLKIVATPDLYNLSVIWAREYNRQHPETGIRVISVSDTKLSDNLMENGNIGFVSDDYFSVFDDASEWKVVIGRDVIVPVINANNPYFDEISRRGVSPETLAGFLTGRSGNNWSALVGGDRPSTVNYYSIADEQVSKGLAGFLNTATPLEKGRVMTDPAELISAIQKDPLGMGFCRLISTMDASGAALSGDIRLLPIDRNGNGTIDYNEKIYADLNTFSRGVWIGKYPKALFTNIYSIASVIPSKEAEVAFLRWVVTDGQQYLGNSGYSDLMLTERQSAVDRLYEARVPDIPVAGYRSVFKPLLFVLTGLILAGLIIDAARRRRRKKEAVHVSAPHYRPALNENTIILPRGIYFDKTHTWSFMEQNGNVKVGIDDFLQHLTGTVTRIRMKSEGEKIKKGDPFLTIVQNGKQLNVYAPISGTIMRVNERLDSDASLVNSSPYNEGWVYMIEPANWLRENQLLFMAEKHLQYIKNELSRFREFLAFALRDDTAKLALVTLQDGGELEDGVLSDLGPELWEEFQTKFMDPSRQLWFYEIF